MGDFCYTCGHDGIVPASGTFVFVAPPNVSGTIEIEDSHWQECAECGSSIIKGPLGKKLDEEAARRKRWVEQLAGSPGCKPGPL